MTTERSLPLTSGSHTPSPSSSREVIVQGSGPALVLAHGAGGGVLGNYGLVLDELARDHTVIGPHYPGAGGTPESPRPLELDDLADLLVDSATAAGHDTFPVIGESLGCAVAVRAATRHPGRITALVLTAGFASPDPAQRLTAQLIQTLGRNGQLDTAARVACLACLSQTELSQLSETEIDARTAATRAGLLPALAHFDLVCRVDVHGDLPKITVPTLVVAPASDRMVLPASTRRMAHGISGAEYAELPGAGHLMNPADRADWLGLVRVFLARALDQEAM